MKKLTFQELAQSYLNQLVKGAFLTVKVGDQVNTMTIGWGTVGYIWNKPVLMVPVRYIRHTYGLMEQTESFTVSVPIDNNMKEALALCGTKSGRDLDKIKASGLNLKPGVQVDTPIISDCELQIECKIIYKQAMEPATLSKEIKAQSYPDHDFHVLYYGEILQAYLLDS